MALLFLGWELYAFRNWLRQTGGLGRGFDHLWQTLSSDWMALIVVSDHLIIAGTALALIVVDATRLGWPNYLRRPDLQHVSRRATASIRLATMPVGAQRVERACNAVGGRATASNRLAMTTNGLATTSAVAQRRRTVLQRTSATAQQRRTGLQRRRPARNGVGNRATTSNRLAMTSVFVATTWKRLAITSVFVQ
jgi:hypothetical protein